MVSAGSKSSGARAIGERSSCWRVEEDAGVKWDDEERAQLHEASRLFDQAHKKFDEIYAARIGKLVVSEIRSGDWRGSE